MALNTAGTNTTAIKTTLLPYWLQYSDSIWLKRVALKHANAGEWQEEFDTRAEDAKTPAKKQNSQCRGYNHNDR
jgi:hypothetical protein